MRTDDGSQKPAEIVTLLFTDLVGSTEMLSRIGDDAAEEARLAHFGLLRDVIAGGGGHEVKNLGDGLMVVFGSALDALKCAVSIQLAARDHNRRGVGPPFHIRIGLHAGEPIRDGADFFGTPVVVASRLCGAARGGQILASLVLVGLIGTRGGFAIHPVGALELKGLADPVPAAEVGWDEDEASSPNPAPTTMAAPGVVRPSTLAPPPNTFVGRDAEVGVLADRLEHARLVTVTGPGGVGKTRLSLHVVDAVAGRYPDGVWCFDLASVPADEHVPSAVASALRVESQSGVSEEDRIVEFLAPKRALLVLDNCEHLLDGASALVQAVVAGTSRIDVLATSREPLGVPGEQRMPLDPLPIPLEADPGAPALVLFAERAAASLPGFVLDDDNLTAACELCRRVDGLPLAIELAAARVVSRTVQEIAADIAERLGAITGGRGRVERHRSIHALVEYSYDLLDGECRRPFEELAVFAGGWTADAATAVSGDDQGTVLDQLARLVDQSLVTARPDGATTRYAMLEPIRAYAEHRLRQRSSYEEARDRHARFFVDFAEGADRQLRGLEPTTATRRHLDDEVANVRVAHRWLVSRGDADQALRLAGALYWYGYEGGPSEVLSWAEESVGCFGSVNYPHLPAACAAAAVGAWRRGDLKQARLHAEQGIIAGADDPGQGRLAIEAMGDAENFAGHFDAAFGYFRQAADLSRAAGDDYQVIADLGHCALSRAYAGHYEEAYALADEVLAVAEAAGHPGMLAWAHFFAGEIRIENDPVEAGVLLERSLIEAARLSTGGQFLRGVAGLSAMSLQSRTGDPAAALDRYPDLIEHWHRYGAWNQLWVTLRTLIEVLARVGHAAPAAVLHGALGASPTATPLVGADAARLALVEDGLRHDLGDDFEALNTQGAGLGDVGAVSYAIETLRGLAASS